MSPHHAEYVVGERLLCICNVSYPASDKQCRAILDNDRVCLASSAPMRKPQSRHALKRSAGLVRGTLIFRQNSSPILRMNFSEEQIRSIWRHPFQNLRDRISANLSGSQPSDDYAALTSFSWSTSPFLMVMGTWRTKLIAVRRKTKLGVPTPTHTYSPGGLSTLLIISQALRSMYRPWHLGFVHTVL